MTIRHDTKTGDYIVLLHGLIRTAQSLKKLEKVFTEFGYDVININYPSTKHPVEDLSNYLKKELEVRCTDKSKKINFITHSLGGVLLRCFLANNKLENLGRVVMLCPPNSGSFLADFLAKFKVANRLIGPALKQITSKEANFPNITSFCEVGVIAGKFDEKVSVNQTKLEGMKDFLIVPRMHTFIMNAKEVITATKNFLETGRF
ncbi:alpha/beta hydrolase [Patescibacteria group bacterium]|nr:alpha/beta hydrolase [Patescibacteria group bacterium]MBU1683492.1 alpha/beta hydrolase [Patescibacteria group bacterium]MBU1935382.1 alpha/beta hydrolase [Patescibacteria group bacterium]